jgi:outer membrane protein assembly factor BamE (lipoprotein component of BamABCDE complex)
VPGPPGPAPFLARLAVLLVLAASCAGALERASRRYKQDRDDASLETIVRSLHTGMSKTEVESLLGPPDYSPTDGQYNYSSSARNRILVVDYRLDTRVTDRLQQFDLMTTGE